MKNFMTYKFIISNISPSSPSTWSGENRQPALPNGHQGQNASLDTRFPPGPHHSGESRDSLFPTPSLGKQHTSRQRFESTSLHYHDERDGKTNKGSPAVDVCRRHRPLDHRFQTGWYYVPHAILHPLLILQKRFLRVALCLPFNTHTEPIFKQLKILRVHEINFFHAGILMYKLDHHMLPTLFHSLFSKTSSVHSYNVRSSQI